MRFSLQLVSVLVVALIFASPAIAQVSVHDGTGTDPDASSMLDVQSTAKGLLVPRMTQAQRNLISGPATGLLIFQTDGTSGYYYWNGSVWTWLRSGSTVPWTDITGAPSFLTAEVDPTWSGTANTTGAVSRTGNVTIGGRLALNSASFDDHLLVQRAGAPDGHFSTSTGDWIQVWPGASGDYTTKGVRLNNSGTVQLMNYTTNGIVRTTGGSGTLSSSGGGISLTSEVTGILPVANGGSGVGTLTGYVKGNGTSPFTASTTVPWSDISGAPTSLPPSGAAGGDLSGTYPNPQVVDDSHNHTEIEAKPIYSWNAGTNPRDFPQAVAASFVQAANGWPSYGSVLHVGTYPNDGGALQLYAPYNSTYGGNSLRYRLGLYNDAGWTAWKTLWDDTNDGAGSGMDADLLDGQQGSYYAAASNISGTTNYVAKFTGGSSVGNSQIYDNGTNVGVGTTANSYKLDVNGSIGLNRNNIHFQPSGGSVATDGTYGIYWHNGGGSSPSSDYGIYRTSGAWTSNTYQQLRLQWATGIELGTSTAYDRSYVNIVSGKGLMVSAGNVGIGTTAPVASLELEGTSANWNETTPGTGVGSIHLDPGSTSDNYGSAVTWGASDASNGDNAQAGIYVRSDGSYGTKMYFGTTDSYAAGSKTRMFINHDGNVGIGTTGPTSKLQVTDRVELSRMGTVGTYNSAEVQQIWSIGRGYNISTANNDFGNSYGITYAHTNAGTSGSKKPISGWGHQIMFTSNGTRNASISMSNGNAYFAGSLALGLTNPTYKLHVNGTIRTNGINEISDARLKTEVIQLSDALAKVLAMRGVNYKWRLDEYPEMELDSTLQFGLIAQELEKVVPELVKTDREGWKSIEYSHIVPLLIEGIKEQQALIGRQQSDIEELRGMVLDLQRHTNYPKPPETGAEASVVK